MKQQNKQNTFKDVAKKVWYFIWEDDSIWSWLVNVILAFVLIKFIVYPGLGLLLNTSHPIVAVVSGSMEHNQDFDTWWKMNEEVYGKMNITKAVFGSFPLKNGFNRGDIIILKGKKAEDIRIGDVIVFRSSRPDPIIHRVVKKWQEDSAYYFQTKGDHNAQSIMNPMLDETRIAENAVIGKALFKIPFLGYIKIGFVELLRLIGIQR